ncbi:cupin domain-containing protein [Haloferula sp. BvORR071]|uniref:cupin domain-containing protein n=1 Tax=Haloferula sp. BvORR071 TaxID=1396141 RepID=UPI000551C7A0|nr:cupin domain-containing protein [Haloferula sp. BvORR071]
MNPIPLPPGLEEFFLLQQMATSQAGVLRLEQGGASSARQEIDPEHAQSVLLIEGEMMVEVDGMVGETIRTGSILTVPKGVKHRFINRGSKPAVAFTVAA